MKVLLLACSAVLFLPCVVWAASPNSTGPAPVLVELFTSERCSSCPPADRLLMELDQKQPVSGAQIIVLSEHVDYWNSLGWKDPFSSKFFSQRQSGYSDALGLNNVYTPQMVVDGTTEFVGNDSRRATQACASAAREGAQVPVRISNVSVDNGVVKAHLEADPVSGAKSGDLYFVVALNHAESQVANGENGGRTLSHVAVVQSLTKVGSVQDGKPAAQDVAVKLAPGTNPKNIRVIAFVQEPDQGKVLGAALNQL